MIYDDDRGLPGFIPITRRDIRERRERSHQAVEPPSQAVRELIITIAN